MNDLRRQVKAIYERETGLGEDQEMRAWTEILPLFIVRWVATRRCEVFEIQGLTLVCPRPGVYFEVQED